MSDVHTPILSSNANTPNTLLAEPPAAAPYRASDLVHWHKCEVPPRPLCGRYWGISGRDADIGQLLLMNLDF